MLCYAISVIAKPGWLASPRPGFPLAFGSTRKAPSLPLWALEGALMGTPNLEYKEYSRNILQEGHKDPVRSIPIIFRSYS